MAEAGPGSRQNAAWILLTLDVSAECGAGDGRATERILSCWNAYYRLA